MQLSFELTFVLLVIFNKKFTATASVNKLLETYEQYLNSSHVIEKQDQVNIRTWDEDLQVKLVDVTTKYRIQMTRHQQHSFKKKLSNKKWEDCVRLYENSTTKLEQAYYLEENKCLRNASSADADEKQAVMQIGREIRKWRRTYRYLLNTCQRANLADPEKTGDCLVRQMERDNYSYAFQRLLSLRTAAVQELHREMTRAVDNLETCLETALSGYLERLRVTMEVLSRCYGNTLV
ncbi:hypothetical protein NE865_12114 [Phthorimaea operculella]|nr:hypothetical protein NE865_12114 [Phthorimaea operculella]